MSEFNVIPTPEQINAANASADEILKNEPQFNSTLSEAELMAIKQMEEEAERQVQAKLKGEQVVRPDLADKTEQVRVAVGKSYEIDNQASQGKPIIEKPVIKPKVTVPNEIKYEKPINLPFDLIPLPSEGKIYPHKKSHVKVAYLNAMSENILTSPNLIQSGKFLEVLLNYQILDDDITYENLHVGDRNAIMIWLRATGYGEMYPVVIYDNDGNPFEAVIDLNTLKYKRLTVEPDEEGLISYYLTRSKKNIKFKFLNEGENNELEELQKIELESGNDILNSVTNRLEKMIIEIDGVRDREAIKKFIKIIPAGDSRDLRNYYDEIEPNVDLSIKVEAPGGGFVETFLPINFNFFWPDYRA